MQLEQTQIRNQQQKEIWESTYIWKLNTFKNNSWFEEEI